MPDPLETFKVTVTDASGRVIYATEVSLPPAHDDVSGPAALAAACRQFG